MEKLLYQVFSPGGQPVLQASERCRYPRKIELDLLAAGYTVRLGGKLLTKTQIKKEAANG